MEKTPFSVHVLICQNTRPDAPEKQSCGGEVAAYLRQELKDYVDEKKLKGQVRITSTNCLGPCGLGPNVMIYPQEFFFNKCTKNTLLDIKRAIEAAL